MSSAMIAAGTESGGVHPMQAMGTWAMTPYPSCKDFSSTRGAGECKPVHPLRPLLPAEVEQRLVLLQQQAVMRFCRHHICKHCVIFGSHPAGIAVMEPFDHFATNSRCWITQSAWVSTSSRRCGAAAGGQPAPGAHQPRVPRRRGGQRARRRALQAYTGPVSSPACMPMMHMPASSPSGGHGGRCGRWPSFVLASPAIVASLPYGVGSRACLIRHLHIRMWLVTARALQQEHNNPCSCQLNQCSICPSSSWTQTVPWQAPVRRNNLALVLTVTHCTSQRTHVLKRDTGDRTRPGPHGSHSLVQTHQRSAVRQISAARSIRDVRMSGLWSMYQCLYCE